MISDKKGFLLIEALIFLSTLMFFVLLLQSLMIPKETSDEQIEQMMNDNLVKEVYSYE